MMFISIFDNFIIIKHLWVTRSTAMYVILAYMKATEEKYSQTRLKERRSSKT